MPSHPVRGASWLAGLGCAAARMGWSSADRRGLSAWQGSVEPGFQRIVGIFRHVGRSVRLVDLLLCRDRFVCVVTVNHDILMMVYA